MAEKVYFTDRRLKAAKPAPAGKYYFLRDTAVPNFVIKVTDKSSPHRIGRFGLHQRFPGKANPTFRAIGPYPAMSLAEGRETGRGWQEDIRRGVDPQEKQKAAQRAVEAERANTFWAAFEQYRDKLLRNTSLRSRATVVRQIEKHVLPRWGDWPLTDIKRRDVVRLINDLAIIIPGGAGHCLSYLRRFFDWAVSEEIIEQSPAMLVKKPTKPRKRNRYLSEPEILAIWQASMALGAFGRCVRLLLVTGGRRTECGSLLWSELDLTKRTWVLPPERNKSDRLHIVPLSDLAIEVLTEAPKLGEFVFTTDGRTAIGGWSQGKERLHKLALAKLREADPEADFPEWRLHDLRRSCATYMGEMGANPFIIGRVLNHAATGVTSQHYVMHDYMREKRAALDAWANRLRSIIEGRAGSNVVDLAAVRG